MLSSPPCTQHARAKGELHELTSQGEAAAQTHQMPRADTESSTAHTVHASFGASSDADACTEQRIALLRCLVRAACSSCAPDERHEQLLKRSAELVAASGARAAAARRAGEHVRGGHAKAATQLASIAGCTQRAPAHGFHTPQARTMASDGSSCCLFGAESRGLARLSNDGLLAEL